MGKPNEISNRVALGVLLSASIVALANFASLCFGLWTLLLVCVIPKDDREILAGVVLFNVFGFPLMLLLLIATILVVVLEKRLPQAYCVVLVVIIATGVVAEVIAAVRLWFF